METGIRGRIHRSGQRADVSAQCVHVDDVEILSGRGGEHPEPRATSPHEVADDEGVPGAVVDALAALQPSARDALARRLARIVPDLYAGHVAVRQVVSPGDAMLERGKQHRARDGQSQETVLERLNLVDVAP